MNREYIPKLAAAGCVDMVVSSPPEGHGMDVAMMDLPHSTAGSYLPGILVVGPGDTLLGDDGVGVQVVRRLGQAARDGRVRRGGQTSAHEAWLVDLFVMAQLDGWKPARLTLVGIQLQCVDGDEHPSDAVARAVPEACRTAIETVQRWQVAT